MKLIQSSERHMECAYYLVLDPCACGTRMTNRGGRRQSSTHTPMCRQTRDAMKLIQASERHMECAYYLVLDPCACGTRMTNRGGRRQSNRHTPLCRQTGGQG
jgi:hypothetical protein